MPECIIRTIVFILLAVSNIALVTASVLLRFGRSSQSEHDQTLTKNGVEDIDFYSSPIDLLCEKTALKQKNRVEPLERGGVPIHLAASDGDLIDIPIQTRGVQ